MSTTTLVKKLALAGTDKGIISIGTIDQPYGESSHRVASIGISLNGNESDPEWKVHIPLENLDEVIATLQSLK